MALFEETKESQLNLIGLLDKRYNNRLPFFNASCGCLGNDSVFLLVSFDKREDWPHGYVENTNYFRMAIYSDGRMEVFTQCLYAKGHRNDYQYKLSAMGIKFRKTTVSTTDKMFEKIDSFISKIEESYR